MAFSAGDGAEDGDWGNISVDRAFWLKGFLLSAPTFLARDTSAPYMDNRPLLVANQPETRSYTAIYVLHDEEIGLVSDAISVVCQP